MKYFLSTQQNLRKFSIIDGGPLTKQSPLRPPAPKQHLVNKIKNHIGNAASKDCSPKEPPFSLQR